MNNSRELALLALYKIEYDGAYSNMALKKTLSGIANSIEKGFITQLVYGVVRRKLTLDYVISQYSSVKIKKMSKFVLLILRMGVYQIYFMDKVPESAAVNESVKLTKKYCQKSAGFVNGILQSVIRGQSSLKYPKSRIEYLSVKYSFTPQMIKILMQYDFCEELLESLNSEPKTSLRINSLKCSELHIDGVEIEKNPLYEYAVTASGFDVTASNEYKEGKFIAQDVAAMMASLALAPKENDVCIDVCAAPGGKTTHIAELMHNKGKITAFDIHPHKVDIIKKNAERMGISIIDAVCADASEYIDKYKETADKVLVDAPCSGLGIIRRKPDIKWQKENTEELPLLQYSILKNAASYLKPGGELVYSTCTLDKKENEDVILEFVKNNNEFELTEIHIPGSLARKNDGFITFFPHIDNVDGFFISKIKRCN